MVQVFKYTGCAKRSKEAWLSLNCAIFQFGFKPIIMAEEEDTGNCACCCIIGLFTFPITTSLSIISTAAAVATLPIVYAGEEIYVLVNNYKNLYQGGFLTADEVESLKKIFKNHKIEKTALDLIDKFVSIKKNVENQQYILWFLSNQCANEDYKAILNYYNDGNLVEIRKKHQLDIDNLVKLNEQPTLTLSDLISCIKEYITDKKNIEFFDFLKFQKEKFLINEWSQENINKLNNIAREIKGSYGNYLSLNVINENARLKHCDAFFYLIIFPSVKLQDDCLKKTEKEYDEFFIEEEKFETLIECGLNCLGAINKAIDKYEFFSSLPDNDLKIYPPLQHLKEMKKISNPDCLSLKRAEILRVQKFNLKNLLTDNLKDDNYPTFIGSLFNLIKIEAEYTSRFFSRINPLEKDDIYNNFIKNIRFVLDLIFMKFSYFSFSVNAYEKMTLITSGFLQESLRVEKNECDIVYNDTLNLEFMEYLNAICFTLSNDLPRMLKTQSIDDKFKLFFNQLLTHQIKYMNIASDMLNKMENSAIVFIKNERLPKLKKYVFLANNSQELCITMATFIACHNAADKFLDIYFKMIMFFTNQQQLTYDFFIKAIYEQLPNSMNDIHLPNTIKNQLISDEEKKYLKVHAQVKATCKLINISLDDFKNLIANRNSLKTKSEMNIKL